MGQQSGEYQEVSVEPVGEIPALTLIVMNSFALWDSSSKWVMINLPHKSVLNLSEFKGRMGHTVMNSCFLQHPFSLSNAICFDTTAGYQYSSAFLWSL